MTVDEWIRRFETKIRPFVNMKILLEDSEAISLGQKNQEEEVEKFIVVNSKELGNEKWFCPLSCKKFTGPNFIRKHIQTKFVEKIEEIKREVCFDCNFLLQFLSF